MNENIALGIYRIIKVYAIKEATEEKTHTFKT